MALAISNSLLYSMNEVRWVNSIIIYGLSHCHEACCEVIMYLFTSSIFIGREARRRGVFIKIFPNHGKQWKVIGVIFFIVDLVPTHLCW